MPLEIEDRARDCCLRYHHSFSILDCGVFIAEPITVNCEAQDTKLIVITRYHLLNIYSKAPFLYKMTSTGHKSPFSEEAPVETILLPAGRADTADNGPSPTEPTGTAPYPSSRGTEDSPWKPSFSRQQSWNEQDMKHRFQERLLGSERGRESGFTEAQRSG
ncbi:hypothetical protein C8Q69DRAFT_278402 [Paecilomyces variotii]|uniref:Uncharacterized protein n=1 Tax=Byssochlamys spectabilis TaxID=264951 RepID=A0A443HTA1_BYSSP|nr:hypothetical protein C8Q69DRAFT_278402 [Paecilomyces variotii]RWQ95014.1 hypothetical protein C8Q69DRAFT_278402 [Paecilomyces variotii]